jgi:hypothetical protein
MGRWGVPVQRQFVFLLCHGDSCCDDLTSSLLPLLFPSLLFSWFSVSCSFCSTSNLRCALQYFVTTSMSCLETAKVMTRTPKSQEIASYSRAESHTVRQNFNSLHITAHQFIKLRGHFMHVRSLASVAAAMNMHVISVSTTSLQLA